MSVMAGMARQQKPQDERRESFGKQNYAANNPYRVIGVGALTQEEVDSLAAEKREQINGR